MRHVHSALMLICLALVASGCANYNVRPGIWELSFQVHESRSGEQIHEIPTREVKILVERGKSAELLEVIEISPTKEHENVVPMYGDVTPGRVDPKPIIAITHADKDWTWNMYGIVRDPMTIVGTNVIVRAKYESIVLEGRWNLKWLADG